MSFKNFTKKDKFKEVKFSIKNKVNNFSTAHKDIVPIGCDLLKIEYPFVRVTKNKGYQAFLK